jgi:hypothetical protein
MNLLRGQDCWERKSFIKRIFVKVTLRASQRVKANGFEDEDR